MPQDTPSRHLAQFLVRFPEGMRERIAEAAKANNRSMNSEIVARLERTFDAEAMAAQTDFPTVSEEAMNFMRVLSNALSTDPKAVAEITATLGKLNRKSP